MALNQIDSDAEAVTEILYHGVGGRTHVTATFPLDQFEYVAERIKAQRQCWAQAAERLLNDSSSNAGDDRVIGLMSMGGSLGGKATEQASDDVVTHPTDIRLTAGGTAGQPCGKSAGLDMTSTVNHEQENAHVSN